MPMRCAGSRARRGSDNSKQTGFPANGPARSAAHEAGPGVGGFGNRRRGSWGRGSLGLTARGCVSWDHGQGPLPATAGDGNGRVAGK